jgi:nitrous oxide reductase accessory protein NosL
MKNRQIMSNIQASLLATVVVLSLLAGCRNAEQQAQQVKSIPLMEDNQFKVRGFHVDLRIQVIQWMH